MPTPTLHRDGFRQAFADTPDERLGTTWTMCRGEAVRAFGLWRISGKKPVTEYWYGFRSTSVWDYYFTRTESNLSGMVRVFGAWVRHFILLWSSNGVKEKRNTYTPVQVIRRLVTSAKTQATSLQFFIDVYGSIVFIGEAEIFPPQFCCYTYTVLCES